MNLARVILVAGILASLSAGAVGAAGPPAVKIEKTKLGKVVADKQGLTLYIFTNTILSAAHSIYMNKYDKKSLELAAKAKKAKEAAEAAKNAPKVDPKADKAEKAEKKDEGAPRARQGQRRKKGGRR